VNYLLPHIQRVPSRIVRDELASEIAQKVGIDSAVLRQELRHVAANRSSAAVKAPAEAQVTDAEKILIRALASSNIMQPNEDRLSRRDGAEEEFDPARQARFALSSERLHQGLATEALIDTLISSDPDITDPMSLTLTDDNRRLLASTLMKEGEELTPEQVEGAVRALRRVTLRRKLEQVQRELQSPRGKDPVRLQGLLAEKVRLKKALMDPGLGEETAAFGT
jgi:DNA primase